jgi:hypothetical protein
MNLCLLSAFLILLTLPVWAQGTMPPASAAPLPPSVLQIEPDERQFFDLGATLARGAFAYAELAKQAAAVQKTRGKLAQVRQLERLDPLAGRSRAQAHAEIRRTEALMQTLNAPASALASVSAAAARLAGPLPMADDAKPLAFFSRPAARTVSALSEFEVLSSLPDDPAIRAWLEAAPSRSAQVWYAEGEIAGLSQIAAAHEMPDLLPPTEQIATDLRGLRDWLALRLPDAPSPEQAALKHDLNAFLEQASAAARPGVRSRKLLSPTQLQALGSISRRLQTQVLGSPPAETATRLLP